MRGAHAGDVTILEGAYVLCEAGRVVEVGSMRKLGPVKNAVSDSPKRMPPRRVFESKKASQPFASSIGPIEITRSRAIR